ncbi:MAG: MGMT family protein [Bacteroidota bacterium]
MRDEGFFNRVYEVTRQIPQGRVTSYGAIAAYLGAPGAARMVGWALNNSHQIEEYIPAHRVVNRNGMLSGKHHFPGINTMEELLRNEGLKVENDHIIDFEKHFWNPNQELI